MINIYIMGLLHSNFNRSMEYSGCFFICSNQTCTFGAHWCRAFTGTQKKKKSEPCAYHSCRFSIDVDNISNRPNGSAAICRYTKVSLIGICIVPINIQFNKKWQILFQKLYQKLLISKIGITLGAFHRLLAHIPRERYFIKTSTFWKSDRVSSAPQLSLASCAQLDDIGK